MTKNKSTVNKLRNVIVEGIEDVKGEDIIIMDLQDIETAVCDYFIICTGTSNTHVNAIAGSVRRKTKEDLKENPWNIEGEDNGEWVLMDYVDIVVHVFQKHTREYYDLESLWGDAEILSAENN